MKSGRKLRDAELRMLAELAEPNKNPHNVWYFPERFLRQLKPLAQKGLAQAHTQEDGWRAYGYSITDAGRQALKTGRFE